MNRSVLKFLAGGLGLVALAVGVLYLVDYLRYRSSPEYRAEQYFKDLEKRYREDPYGGSTPEETLQLFIDALKKGDVELASKYFIIDEHEKWRRELTGIKSKGFLSEMVNDLEKTKITKKDGVAFFTLLDKNNVVVSELVMHRNSLNNRWKITEL